ncbi:methyltransferase domain-containing protein [Bradyrhizobium sp. LMTR 3]|uniref:class I SAM-dependent methyltransferase n=1 Tax=Bradyrhizobium sp. LMTR 3 TaxID=189873 RepID=UPI000810CA03|nr:methyltransferase domain-containing protein [Bradyrhizobium sp. LMTR 3]OCK58177.1 methyltransferase type 11 [Bradyrhizobium sp. LMTR 3]
MTALHEDGRDASLRVLVALASYGTSNDRYLARLIREYRSMPFDIDIVVLSNIDKSGRGVECRVGTPAKNPWSLPFAHKPLFAERANKYDLFIYSEDDILITEKNLRAFLEVTAVLQQDEIAGYLRIEKGSDGEENYPDIHENFHWDSTSVRSRGRYTLAHLTNEHAACYVLTQAQLRTAIQSGGFLVDPYEGKYDLLCTAATDPYTQCGLKKFVPVSHVDDFTVHHLSNKYVGRVGISAAELRDQTEALIRIAERCKTPSPLFNTETKLSRGLYSKDYYEPVSEEVISAIPPAARSVLSIGCGSGATEKRLIERGLRVVAMPLDPVVSSGAAARGVEMIYGDIDELATLAHGEKFDCILCLNVLHLAHDPVVALSTLKDCLSDSSSVIIQTPSMLSLRTIRQTFRDMPVLLGKGYSSTGVHLSTARAVKSWCTRAGMKVNRTIGTLNRQETSRLGRIASAVGDFLPAPLAISMATSIVVSARRLPDERSQLASQSIRAHDTRRALSSSEGESRTAHF